MPLSHTKSRMGASYYKGTFAIETENSSPVAPILQQELTRCGEFQQANQVWQIPSAKQPNVCIECIHPFLDASLTTYSISVITLQYKLFHQDPDFIY